MANTPLLKWRPDEQSEWQIVGGGGGSCTGGGMTASIFVTGLDENSTVTATKGEKTIKGKYAEDRNPAYIGLPEGYTQLEYIESTGTQYIDTKYQYVAGQNLYIRCKLKAVSGSGYFFGGRAVPAVQLMAQASINSGAYLYYSGGYIGSNAIASVLPTEVSIVYENGVLTYTCYGQTYSTSITMPSVEANLWLFASNGYANASCAISEFSLSTDKDSINVANYIPAKRNSDGAIGMYNTVTGEFEENAGTGEFLAGEETPAMINGRFEITGIAERGVWTVTATDGEHTDAKDVLVDGSFDFEVSLFDVFGISRDITNPSPAWARTDAAVGMSATASVGTVAGSSDFDSVMPWAGIKRETLSTGDVMVKIPKFWFQRYREGNVEHIKISSVPNTGFTLHPAFNHSGVECNHIYVGAYKTSSNNKSVTGATPQGNQIRSVMRSNAKLKGNGWSLIDISALSAIQMLMLVEFADNNVQSKIGRGYCYGNSASIQTGSCDNVTNLTGRPAGTDGKVDVIWRGIEGFWGNVWEWVDGLNFNDGKYYVCNDISKYADDTASNYEQLSFTGTTNWSFSYITEEGLDTGNNPHVIMPKTAGSGSESTYDCDVCWSSTGWRLSLHGGAWDSDSGCGLFAAHLASPYSGTSAAVCSRLLYIPVE